MPRLLMLLLVSLYACGDDDDGRPRYRIEIDGVTVRTPVSSLTPNAQRQLCQSYDVFVESHIDLEAVAYLACLPPALVFGGTRTGCEQRLTECMDLFPEPIEVRADAQTDEICFSNLASCQASVADIEGCINLNLDLVFEIIEDWSCALYDDQQVRQQAERMMDVVELCADLEASCNRFASPLGPD